MRIFDNPNVNFLKWRWHALALSVIVIGAGLATIARNGLNLGVDFSGGTVLVLKFNNPTHEDAIRAALPNSNQAVVQRYGNVADNQVLIRMPMMSANESLDAQAAAIEGALRASNIGDFTVQSRDLVGPVIGEDLKRKGIWATIASLGGILGYIWFRFRLTFAVGAIAATLHDVLVTLVFLNWFGYDLSLNVVADYGLFRQRHHRDF
jgi:preprotein translocase subunit SecF